MVTAAALFVHGMSAPSAAAAPRVTPNVNAAREPALSVPPPPPYSASPIDPVRVRVYRSTQIRNEALRLALGVAEATFAAADIHVQWTVCEPGECNTPPAQAERLVRLVRRARGEHRDLRCLGDAFIDPQQRSGALATVYVDQVVEVARRSRVDHARLLGHAIAHEIGHLLLGSVTHGASGLMREIWSQKELRAGRTGDWALLPLETAAIRLRLSAAPRPASS